MEQQSPYISSKVPPVVRDGETGTQGSVRNQDHTPMAVPLDMDVMDGEFGEGGDVGRDVDQDVSLDISHNPGSFVTPPTTPVKSPVVKPPVQSGVSPPAAVPTKSTPAPTRRSDRALKPSSRYSAKEYDLSGVWYWGGGDSE